MKGMFSDARKDEDGRIILGNPDRGCGFCGAAAEASYAAAGNLVWWHAPSHCCRKRARVASGQARLPYKDQA